MKSIGFDILFVLALLTMMCASCGGIEPEEQTAIPDPTVQQDPTSSPYCGDGVCDEGRGENEWWCSDCGYSPLTNGPKDGGYCGDGVCFGGETMTSCFEDCRPVARNGQSDDPPWDSDWKDLLPQDLTPPNDFTPPGPLPPEQMEQDILLEKDQFDLHK